MELHFAQRDISQLKESIRKAASAKAQAESELLDSKKTVKDLVSRIEESNSRVKKIAEVDKPKKRKDGLGLFQSNTEDYQYAEVVEELEYVKQELSKLKLDLAFALQEKELAEKETEASRSKLQDYSSTLEAFREEIDELNDELVLVELARIEALKEYGAIEAQRKEAARQYSSMLEGRRKKVNDLIEETHRAKEIEEKLAVTNSDINMLQNELDIIKAIDIKSHESSMGGEESESSSSLNKVLQELEDANNELAAIKDGGFQIMASMDIIRDELKNHLEQTARLRKRDQKADLTIQSLNSKLLRAKSKLEAVSAAEEKANSISSSLIVPLGQLKTEAEAAQKEKELNNDEIAMIKTEVSKTLSEIELAEAKLEASIHELTAVKSSEALALENLKGLVERSMRDRAQASQHSSTITISTFEYEYLKGRAVGADEIADKKVAAAEAWIEALTASENEILVKTEITHREIRALQLEDECMAGRIEQPNSTKGVAHEEVWNLGEKHEKILEQDKLQFDIASSRKSINRKSISTPTRRPKFRKSASPGWHMSKRSITGDRMRKGVPNLANLFSRKNVEGSH